MEYRWIENIKDFQDIAEEWDKLLFLSREDNPFILSDFILAWWKYYSPGLKLMIFAVFQNGRILGGIPLCQYRNGRLEYIGGITANYTEILSIENNQRFIWEMFLGALKDREDWRSLSFKRFRKSRIKINELEELLSKNKNSPFVDINNVGYTYLINIPENFAGYIDNLPKKLRYYVRRSEKEFSKLGSIFLYSLENDSDLTRWCSRYIELSRDSFKRRGRESAFEDTTYRMFFEELMRVFYKAGYLDAHALKLNDRIVAVHFGYSIGNNLNYIFPAFDIDFADINPGHLMIYKLIEVGSERKNRLFDLYTGYHLYKEQWSDHKEEILDVEIRRRSIRNNLERLIERRVRQSSIATRLKDAVKTQPLLLKAARRIKKIITYCI